MRSKQTGFTLVEILVVLAIIGILMTLVLGLFSVAGNKSTTTQARAEIAGLMNEFDLFFEENNRYPDDLNEFSSWYTSRHSGTVWAVTQDGDAAEPLDPWGEPYVYDQGPTPFVYEIGSKGPDGQNGDGGGTFGEGDDITNRNGAL